MVILVILVLSEKDETIYGSLNMTSWTWPFMRCTWINYSLAVATPWVWGTGGEGWEWHLTNTLFMISVFFWSCFSPSDRASLQWSNWIWNKGSQLYVYVTIQLYDWGSSCTNICSQANLENGEGELFTVKITKSDFNTCSIMTKFLNDNSHEL